MLVCTRRVGALFVFVCVCVLVRTAWVYSACMCVFSVCLGMLAPSCVYPQMRRCGADACGGSGRSFALVFTCLCTRAGSRFVSRGEDGARAALVRNGSELLFCDVQILPECARPAADHQVWRPPNATDPVATAHGYAFVVSRSCNWDASSCVLSRAG